MCCAQLLWPLVFTKSYLSQQIAHCELLLTRKKQFPRQTMEIFWQLYRCRQSDGSHWVLLFCVLVAGCGVCKRMQPIFQQAATETKGKYVSLLNPPPTTTPCTLGPLSYCISCLWSAAVLLWCLRITRDLSAASVWTVILASGESAVWPNWNLSVVVFPAKTFSQEQNLSNFCTSACDSAR